MFCRRRYHFDREKRMRSLRRIDFSWYFDNPISRPRRKSSSHSLGENLELCRVVPCNPSHAFPCFCPPALPRRCTARDPTSLHARHMRSDRALLRVPASLRVAGALRTPPPPQRAATRQCSTFPHRDDDAMRYACAVLHCNWRCFAHARSDFCSMSRSLVARASSLIMWLCRAMQLCVM